VEYKDISIIGLPPLVFVRGSLFFILKDLEILILLPILDLLISLDWIPCPNRKSILLDRMIQEMLCIYVLFKFL
jgi:hypothetical protein